VYSAADDTQNMIIFSSQRVFDSYFLRVDFLVVVGGASSTCVLLGVFWVVFLVDFGAGSSCSSSSARVLFLVDVVTLVLFLSVTGVLADFAFCFLVAGVTASSLKVTTPCIGVFGACELNSSFAGCFFLLVFGVLVFVVSALESGVDLIGFWREILSGTEEVVVSTPDDTSLGAYGVLASESTSLHIQI
tara:strand:+ start:98 stop:664 length:567 start_codon:yes stop_codon:yes gene_type:complete